MAGNMNNGGQGGSSPISGTPNSSFSSLTPGGSNASNTPSNAFMGSYAAPGGFGSGPFSNPMQYGNTQYAQNPATQAPTSAPGATTAPTSSPPTPAPAPQPQFQMPSIPSFTGFPSFDGFPGFGQQQQPQGDGIINFNPQGQHHGWNPWSGMFGGDGGWNPWGDSPPWWAKGLMGGGSAPDTDQRWGGFHMPDMQQVWPQQSTPAPATGLAALPASISEEPNG